MADRQERKFGVWVVVVLASCAILLLLVGLPGELTGKKPPVAPAASASSVPSADSAPQVVNCAPISSAGNVRIDTKTPKSSDEVDTFPFAVEIGGVAVYRGGFAVGLKREAEAGTVAEILLLSERGERKSVVSLGRLRGDVGPPMVAAGGERLMAAVLEPNASGMARRMISIREDKAHWGAEFELGRTESFGADMLVTEKESFLVHEDLVEDAKRSQIVLRGVSSVDAKSRNKARIVSRATVDAEMPRLVERVGGYWLTYVARGLSEEGAAKAQGGAKPAGRYAAEAIEPSRLELLRLDENGRPLGEARAVTPLGGHVLTYDVRRLGEDGLLIVWRDDDTPSGSGGGEINLLRLDASGVGERQLVVSEDIGAGTPQLIGSWLAYASRRDEMRLARIDAEGLIAAPAARTSSLGRAQLLVGLSDGAALLAQPHGTGVVFSVVKCGQPSR